MENYALLIFTWVNKFIMDIKKLIVNECNFDNVLLETSMLMSPPNPDMGDYCLPCFSFAKDLKKAPNLIAQELSEHVKIGGFVSKTQVVGGYLNFFVNKQKLIFNVLNEILLQDKNFGRQSIGQDRTICIDYSSVNLAKYMHIGHLSTTTIGESLKRIYSFLGYKTIGINYIGDYGTPFGKMIAAYKLWGNEQDVVNRGVDAIQDLYIKFCAEAEKDPSLDDLARVWFKKIETKDPEALQIYNMFIKLAIEETEKIYSLLNIKFDSWRGESYYNDKMTPIIQELEQKGLLQDSQGAKIVDLSQYDLGVCLIQKSDGTSLYATRDLAAADDRYINYNFDKSIYVTDVSQRQHFAQFFKILKLLDRPYADNLLHVYYGRLSLPDGKIASRRGKQAILRDIFRAAIDKAQKVMIERGSNSSDTSTTAQNIGIGAVVFSALKYEKTKDVVFDIDQALNFDGETSPYIQYTHARCCSILQKSNNNDLSQILKVDFDFNQVNSSECAELIKLLNNFPDTVINAAKDNEPCYISRLLIDICKEFNKFYNNNRIISGDKIFYTRLALVKATKIVLCNGLNLLNIAAIEKM